MKLYMVYFMCITLEFGYTLDYFPQCKKSDPEIETCFLKGVVAVQSKLKEGISEINLPPLEPFKMESLLVNTSITGVTVVATVKHIVALGGSNFKIDYLKINLVDTYAGELKLRFPQLQVSADYDTQGSKMLLFTVSGGGSFTGSFSDVVVEVKVVASPFTKDDKEYLQVDSVTTHVIIGKGDLKINPAEDTFAGRAAASFINWNPSVVLKTFSPVVDETTASIVKQYLNEVLSAVPLNEFLVD